MNEKVFNELASPIYTISQIVVAEALAGKVFQGSSGLLLSTAASQQMVMVLTNPIGSGVRAVLDWISISVKASALVQQIAVFDGIAAGLSAVSAYNLNTAFQGDSPACTLAAAGGAGVSLTGGNIISWQYVNVADQSYPCAVVITPGHSFGMRYVFNSSGNRGTFLFRWYEIPPSGGFA